MGWCYSIIWKYSNSDFKEWFREELGICVIGYQWVIYSQKINI